MGLGEVNRQLRRARRSISRKLHAGAVEAAELADFADSLSVVNEPGVTTDDVEWLRVIARVQARLDECDTAAQFGLPHGNWRDWDIPFDKTRELYDRMRRSGAVQRVEYYFGGEADVEANDLRAIQSFLAMQLRQRLRAMDMLAAERWSRWRQIGAWLGQHATAVIVGVAIIVGGALIVAYIGLAT